MNDEPKLYSEMTPEEKMLEVQKIPTKPREEYDLSVFNPVAEVLGIDPCKKRIQKLISEFVKKLKMIGIHEFEIDEFGTLAMAYHSVQSIIKEYEAKLK